MSSTLNDALAEWVSTMDVNAFGISLYAHHCSSKLLLILCIPVDIKKPVQGVLLVFASETLWNLTFIWFLGVCGAFPTQSIRQSTPYEDMLINYFHPLFTHFYLLSEKYHQYYTSKEAGTVRSHQMENILFFFQWKRYVEMRTASRLMPGGAQPPYTLCYINLKWAIQ